MVIDEAIAHKTILCEKSIAPNLRETHLIIRAGEANQVLFQMAMATRYLRPIQRMKHNVETDADRPI